jgi:hypothetical protein
VIDQRAVVGTVEPVENTEARPANAALVGALNQLLGSFGVEAVDTQDRVLDSAREVLAQRGHRVDEVALRYRELVIETDPVGARLLDVDRDMVLGAVESKAPGAVDALVVVARRGRGRRRLGN